MDRQIETNDLLQFALPISRAAKQSDISDGSILKQVTFHAALLLCMRESGLEDKEIYGPLGLESAQFSRILKSSMHFPPELVPSLMDLCGNEIPLRWLALTRGYELVPLLSTVEEERDQALIERDDARRELATIKKFIKETS